MTNALHNRKNACNRWLQKILVYRGVSDATKLRPELDRKLDHLRCGDLVLVTKLFRLGRSLAKVFGIVEVIEHQRAGLMQLAEIPSIMPVLSAVVNSCFESLQQSLNSRGATFENEQLRDGITYAPGEPD